MADRPRKIKFGSSFENFIVTLQPDSIDISSPSAIGIGTTAKDKIFYDEIVAVYRYRKINWTSLSVSLLILVFGVGIIACCYSAGSSLWTAISSLGTLACLGFTLYRGFIQKKMMVKVVSPIAAIEFPCRNEAIFDEVISHLKIINTPRQAPAVEHA